MALYSVGYASEVTLETCGFVNTTISPGQTRAVSMPLRSKVVFQGIVTSFTEGIVSANENWDENAYGPYSSNPHLCFLLTGANAGRYLKILSNTGTSLHLDAAGEPGLSIDPGDKYQIVEGRTLKGLFTNPIGGLLTGVDPDSIDNVLLLRNNAWRTYYNDGTKWLLKDGGMALRDTTCILPTEGMVVVRRGNAPLSLIVEGRVPSSPVTSVVKGGSSTLLANAFPADGRLEALDLASLPGWKTAKYAARADHVLIATGTTWLTYFNNGTGWLREGGGTSLQNPQITNASAILIERAEAADAIYSQPAPVGFE